MMGFPTYHLSMRASNRQNRAAPGDILLQQPIELPENQVAQSSWLGAGNSCCSVVFTISPARHDCRSWARAATPTATALYVGFPGVKEGVEAVSLGINNGPISFTYPETKTLLGNYTTVSWHWKEFTQQYQCWGNLGFAPKQRYGRPSIESSSAISLVNSSVSGFLACLENCGRRTGGLEYEARLSIDGKPANTGHFCSMDQLSRSSFHV